MSTSIPEEIAALKQMTVTELQRKHLEALGEPTGARHKDYLFKRIAWRLQAQRSGGLSERARQRAEELANDADLRTTAPKAKVDEGPIGHTTPPLMLPVFRHDPRIPLPGSFITRPYKGRDIVVKVRPKGFEFDGQMYRSLSAVATAVTGKHWNGYHFFNLPGKDGTADE
jgi:hypothetical protein